MQVDKKEKKSRRIVSLKLEDLPPRVIVHEILTYHCVKKPRSPYDLFGYFLLDRRRNIWFIFTSVQCNKRFNKAFIDSSKLFHLAIRTPKPELLPVLLSESSNMVILRSLQLIFRSWIYVEAPGTTHSDLFSKPGCFKNLTDLKIVFGDINWGTTPSPVWKNLRKLSYKWKYKAINNKTFISNVLSKPDVFPNLVFLELEYLDLEFVGKRAQKNPKRLKITVPRLRTLHLSSCRGDIEFDHGGKIEKLYIARTSEEIARKVYESSPLLRVLETRSNSWEIDKKDPKWFLNKGGLNTLKHLKKVKISRERKFKGNSRFIGFGKDVEEIELVHMESLKEDVFWRVKYPKLTTLLLLGVRRFKGDRYFSFCVNLKTIIFVNLRSLSDEFFRKNELPNLEELDISYLPKESSFCGSKWSKLSKLRKFSIHHAPKFDDSFFWEQQLDSLEDLSISKCNAITGRRWNKKFGNLKTFCITTCKKMDDEVLVTNTYMSLRKLGLTKIVNLSGKKWRTNPSLGRNLEELRVVGCRKFRVEIFEESKVEVEQKTFFPELKYLCLRRIKELSSSKNWIPIPKIKSIEFDSYENLPKIFHSSLHCFFGDGGRYGPFSEESVRLISPDLSDLSAPRASEYQRNRLEGQFFGRLEYSTSSSSMSSSSGSDSSDTSDSSDSSDLLGDDPSVVIVDDSSDSEEEEEEEDVILPGPDQE